MQQRTLKKNSSIVVVTHELYYGATQALRDYLNSIPITNLLFISHPIKQEKPKSYIQIFYKGKLRIQKNYSPATSILVVEFFYQMVLTILCIVMSKKKYDYIIAANPLNCLAAIICRDFRLVKGVVFYSIDFTPKRFSSAFINYIYHYIEKYCVKNANERWNVSPRIAQGREQYLKIQKVDYLQKVVPIGVWRNDLSLPNGILRKENSLIFVGHILKKQGIQIVLFALPGIQKIFKNIHFTIIGGGEYLPELKKIIHELHIEKITTLTNWEYDPAKIRSMLLSSSIAVAAYDPNGATSENFTYYADPTKIKSYLSSGLPVIMTNISYNASILERQGCAVIVEYTSESIEKAIVALLTNKTKLESMRMNALRYMQKLTWEHIFATALRDI